MAALGALLGQTLDDKYRLDDVIGSGGMGVVYRATHLQLDRAVAVKLVRRDVSSDRGLAERFGREARTVARLRHPHIVTVHDFGVAAGVGAYLVMELLEGRSLREEVRQHDRLPVAPAVEIGLQASLALQAAHESGVVHRDVKPENIFLEGAGEKVVVKVLDFGIARLETAAGSQDAVTQPGALLGTPRYMSPEQFESGPVDARSDVYSLGCVLYEALTGRPPFTSDSPAALQIKHAVEAPPPPRRHNPEIGEELEAVVLRALAKRPEERHQSAAELAEALKGAVKSVGGLETRATVPLEYETAAPRAFLFPPFRLQFDVDVLRRGDEVVTIERQPVRVLRYLIENRDRMVTKEELLDRLWPDVFTTDSVLKRAVSMIRRALGDEAKGSHFVRTYHGQGYQFVAPVTIERVAGVATDDGPGMGRATEAGAGVAETPVAGGEKTRVGALTNLPHAVTSFVGRERELGEIRGALTRSRLVTLLGPGGIGKTRLAIEAARPAFADLGEFPDGVWIAELAPVGDETLVPAAVAKALGVREEPAHPLAETLATWLEQKRLLLVLDNCERVIGSCAALVEHLLSSCGELRVLATSREALAVQGEKRLQIPALSGTDAQRLFVERAAAFRSEGATYAEAAVERLCVEFEGLPLAIELAAANTRALTVEQILGRMKDRFRLLTGGPRTASRRQQTLRATVEWSHELLTDGERALFRRLSVFSGGWALEAAEAVCPLSVVRCPSSPATTDNGQRTTDVFEPRAPRRQVDRSGSECLGRSTLQHARNRPDFRSREACRVG
jgi:DNA-binding winged helix-turn-helix (wHTH) protein